MYLCFKKTFETLLKVKKILDKQIVPLNDALFDFLEEELCSFMQQIRDDHFSSEILMFLRSPRLTENFNKLFFYFEERKSDFLKKKIFLVFGRNKKHFEVVENSIISSDFECDFLSISKAKGGTKTTFSTLVEKISSSFKVIFILSPNGKGKQSKSKKKSNLRLGLNVVLEAGLNFGILNQDNVILLWDEKTSNRGLVSDFKELYTINIRKNKVWKDDLMNKLKEFSEEWKNKPY